MSPQLHVLWTPDSKDINLDKNVHSDPGLAWEDYVLSSLNERRKMNSS